MARLKCLNLKLVFQTSYSTHPIVIKYKGRQVTEVNLQIEQINQKESFEFSGYSPKDKKQKVICTLQDSHQQVDLQNIASFQMQNNLHVENVKIGNCKEICFNGTLAIEFNKEWFRHNILAGANLDTGYVNWDKVSFSDEEVFCVGDSFTFGFGVATNENWPSMLAGKVCNFGSKGLSHDGCLQNVQYILEHSKHVKQIICLLPAASRKLFKFDFLGCNGMISMDTKVDRKLPLEYALEIQNIKNFIISKNIEEHWTRTCSEIIALCESNNVDCWLSSWDKDMYTHIPNKNRLPVFPDMDTFKERASDNLHPHKKHYELFSHMIKPYIDKTPI